MKHLILPALLATMLVSGCTAGATAGVGAGAGNGTTPGNGATPATGGASASSFYQVGRKWVYDFTSTASGSSTKTSQTWECTAVDGDTATLKISISGPQGDTTTTTTVKSGQLPQADGKTVEYTYTDMGTESVAVLAGTYNAKKFVSTVSDANADTTATQWVDPTVGIIKMISTSKPKISVPGLPAGMDLTATLTMELKSFTK